MSVGETALSKLGLTGVPIINVENACSSGSTAFWQAYWGITSGIFDLALAFGAEKVPSGPVTVTAAASPDRYIGSDHMMAGYALRMRRYMEDTGAPATALAQVAVKARQNAALNPYAHRKDTFTVEEVLNSRPIADPLTLYQCCPTSEGAAAAVLCAKDSLGRYSIDKKRSVRIAAAALTSGNYNGKGSDHSAFSPYRTEPAALQAYEMSGLGPEDIDLVQVHDAATIGELQQLEALHLVPWGEAWRATAQGRTALAGDIPTNTDGGLLAMGHPFGASGIRMIHETVTQLRQEAGPRQVADPRVGLAQCSGAGDVTTVHILTR
jgi:acetyl-CoA acetyltransferase